MLLALGSIGHNAVLRTLGLKASNYKFGHGAEFKLPGGQWLIDSYHCSRYNTNTRQADGRDVRGGVCAGEELAS